MTLKVSINLPGDTLITVEASEPQVFQQVVSLALKELPRDLMQMRLGTAVPDEVADQGKNVSPELLAPDTGPEFEEDSSMSILEHDESEPSPLETGEAESEPSSVETGEEDEGKSEAEESFVRFCRAISPVADMRRVVLAIEGARRHLNISSVSESELVDLFNLVGWQQPGSFLQALRNAARTKFRWLERIPGRPGYYTITQLGRDRVIGSNQ